MEPTKIAPVESHPFLVKLPDGSCQSFTRGREAWSFVRSRKNARLFHVAYRMVHLDYADQILPSPDKAKSVKGALGAFASCTGGQSTKVVSHYVARETVMVRLY